MPTELWQKSASDLTLGYASGEWSPVEVIDAIFDLIEKVNPQGRSLTSGGSSCVAVLVVCCGLGPEAIGTGGGESIPRPESHAGLVGLNPSRHRIPRCDGFPAILRDFETIGPITRKVADL